MRDAEVRLKEAIKFAHIAKDHAGEAKGLENLAELYRTQFKASEMTTLLWESSEAFRRAGEIEEFKRLQAACGESLGAQGRMSDGIDLCKAGLEKPELRRRKVLFQKGQRYDMGDFALSTALIDLLRRSGDFKGALKEISRLMSMADSLNSQTLLAKVKLELALTHESAGDLDASLKALIEAEGILRSEGDHEGLIAVHMRRGIIEEKRGDEASAIKSYAEAIRHAETSGNDRARFLAEENIKALRSA
jgi:tetratricopeptide (TPR) repeat protein